MKKFIYLLMGSMFLAVSLSAQSIQDKIDKAAKSPDREKNAAKADLRLVDKKKITDSTVVTNATTPDKPKKKKRKS